MERSFKANRDGSARGGPLHDASPGRAAAVGETGPQAEYDELLWMRHALLAGIVGASIVSIVFLCVDLISGRAAMWTPAFLGSALFRSEAISSQANPLRLFPVVAGYTAIHGVVFFGFALFAGASRLAPIPARPLTFGAATGMAIALFVGLEIVFALLGWLVGPDLALPERMGLGWVAAANALAAVGITYVIDRGARTLCARTTAAGRPDSTGDAKAG